MSPRLLLGLIVAVAVEYVVVGRIILQFILLAVVGGLLLGALVGIVCGLQRHKTMHGIGSGSLGGFFGGILWAVVIGMILASLPVHTEHTEWGSRKVMMSEEIVVPMSCLLFVGCSGYFAWTRTQRSLSPSKSDSTALTDWSDNLP